MKMSTGVYFLIFLAMSIILCSADLLFQEGFLDQSNLPGGTLDVHGEPNTPFYTNTDRQSDGITSTAAHSSTSPRFPYYLGAEANVSDRYLRYARYKESAAEQGVAIYGNDGPRAKEEALLKITNMQNYESLPAPNRTFTVYAAIKWNPSDFAIQDGETYNITVFGDQTGYSDQFWYDGGIRVNAEGYSSYFDSISNCYVGLGRCRAHLKKKRRLPSANWMSLSCAIGEFVRPLTEIQEGFEATYRWLPLDEAALGPTIFNVGRTVQFRATHTGQLICFANDGHTLYWNNLGSLEVTVTRVSWPPKPSTYLFEQLLPACDSAQVVYVNQGNNSHEPGKIRCNPNGGGSGWTEKDILKTTATYGSGAPTSLYGDLPPEALA